MDFFVATAYKLKWRSHTVVCSSLVYSDHRPATGSRSWYVSVCVVNWPADMLRGWPVACMILMDPVIPSSNPLLGLRPPGQHLPMVPVAGGRVRVRVRVGIWLPQFPRVRINNSEQTST